MQIFAGLGNPGPQYAFNRHNVGFMAVDVLHDAYGFGPWKARFQGLVAEGAVGGEKLFLLKPATFMNESGRSVGEMLHFYKVGPEVLTVFHDDLDLDPDRVKVKRGGGAGGHNGLRSIDRHAGRDYRRVRIGIGHPNRGGEYPEDKVLAYVLGNFSRKEQEPLAHLLADIADHFPLLVEGADDKFMNRLALDRPK